MKPAPTFFKDAAAFRRWLQKNHATAPEIFVGFYKKDSGRGGITYQEALDEALCFGWIDGVRYSVDAISYMNRFSPRKKSSNWSAVNVRRVEELIAEGRMAPPGLAVYESRDHARTERYSYERETCELAPEHQREFKKHRAAWAYFEKASPYYRRMAAWYVMSAKKPETQARRLARLIADSAAGRKITDAAEPEKKTVKRASAKGVGRPRGRT